MSIKAILLDDEPHVIDLLTDYCSKIELIDLLATFNSPVEALQYLNTHPVDLLICDINMPQISGIDMAKSINKQVKIIFVTAYDDYAANAYELDVIDYIVKPVLLPRFIKAIGKVQNALTHFTEKPNPPEQASYIFVKDAGIKKRIFLDDILYLHAQGDYTEVFLKDDKLFLLGTLSTFVQSLPGNCFLRIHRSIVVNISKIDSIDKDHLVIAGTDLTIGKTYRAVIDKMF